MARQRQRPKHLAKKLLAIRKKLGLSQSELAERLELTAAGVPRISEWEHDKREPDLIVLLRYARLAGIRMATIVDDRIKLPK